MEVGSRRGPAVNESYDVGKFYRKDWQIPTHIGFWRVIRSFDDWVGEFSFQLLLLLLMMMKMRMRMRT